LDFDVKVANVKLHWRRRRLIVEDLIEFSIQFRLSFDGLKVPPLASGFSVRI
jgi:hypothetical protein